MKYIPPDQHIRLSFDLEHVDGDDDWQVGIVYSTTENAYQGNMIYFSATSGHNEINFVTPGYFWRVRILHIPTAQDMEFNLDNFHIENLTQDSASKCHAAVISATDYSPFGAPLPGRTYQASEYRFGFNSKEKDDETYGEGNAYDFGARIYDARLGRFLSIDPLVNSYPEFSPFQFAANIPIKLIDFNGEGPIDPKTWERKSSLLLVSTNEFIVFAIYPKSLSPRAYDKSLFNTAVFKGYLNGSDAAIFITFIESFLGNEPQKLQFKDPFKNRNRENDERAGTTYQIGAHYAIMSAAESGNYDYSERPSDNKLRITSVTDGIISQVNNYVSSWGDNYVLESSTNYAIEYYSQTKAEFIDGKQFNVTTNYAKVTETTTYAKGNQESKTYTNLVSQIAEPTTP